MPRLGGQVSWDTCLSTVPPGEVRAGCWATAGVLRMCPVPAAPPLPSLRSFDAAPKIPSLTWQEAAAPPALPYDPRDGRAPSKPLRCRGLKHAPTPRALLCSSSFNCSGLFSQSGLGVWQNRLAFAPGTPHFTYFPRESALL